MVLSQRLQIFVFLFVQQFIYTDVRFYICSFRNFAFLYLRCHLIIRISSGALLFGIKVTGNCSAFKIIHFRGCVFAHFHLISARSEYGQPPSDFPSCTAGTFCFLAFNGSGGITESRSAFVYGCSGFQTQLAQVRSPPVFHGTSHLLCHTEIRPYPDHAQ